MTTADLRTPGCGYYSCEEQARTDDLRTRWTLRDTDDPEHEDGYTETGTPEALAGYLDGPVRASLTDQADGGELDDLIAAFRVCDLAQAQRLGEPFCIHVSEATSRVGDIRGTGHTQARVHRPRRGGTPDERNR